MGFHRILVPSEGHQVACDPISAEITVPVRPIIPFIEGDGIGPEITPVMKSVVDRAVECAYAGGRKIAWMEVYAGEKACEVYGDGQWLPEETVTALREYRVAIKGPLTTPVGGGFRSINVALRQKLDLYVCQRPVSYFSGVPSPVKHPEQVDMVIFRENSEDIYAGIEWQQGTPEAKRVIDFLKQEMGVTQIRFPTTAGVGIKAVSKEGSQRLVRKALQYAIDHNRSSVTLVHKGNIMKFTEGAFKEWGYACARDEFGAELLDGGPWYQYKNPITGESIVVKDVIADAFLQHILLNPADFDVIATLNLNGDYISDALAAQVGGIGIAPGANLGDGVALFEATHGTAPRFAGQNKLNPGSLILSAEMMLRHLGWGEAADLIIAAMSKTILAKQVTCDFAQLMPGVEAISCSDFGERLIANMG